MRRALCTLEAELGDLVPPPVGVVVVDRHGAPHLVAEVKDGGGAGLRHLRRGMADGLGVHARRVAEERADEIEIVDRVDGDLYARKIFQEGEEGPGRVDRHTRLDVDEPPEEAAVDRVLDRERHRREAQLEIDRGLELPLAAGHENRRRLVEIGPHRLLDHDSGAGGQAFERREMRGRGRREVEDRPVGRESSEPNTRTPNFSPTSFARSALRSTTPAIGKPPLR